MPRKQPTLRVRQKRSVAGSTVSTLRRLKPEESQVFSSPIPGQQPNTLLSISSLLRDPKTFESCDDGIPSEQWYLWQRICYEEGGTRLARVLFLLQRWSLCQTQDSCTVPHLRCGCYCIPGVLFPLRCPLPPAIAATLRKHYRHSSHQYSLCALFTPALYVNLQSRWTSTSILFFWPCGIFARLRIILILRPKFM